MDVPDKEPINPPTTLDDAPEEADSLSKPMGLENEKENPFDSNFDAGVEADEETDPKKFIQQLTGKLSQSLQDYSSEDKMELAKYVMGMLASQTVKDMDANGKEKLIKKIENTPSESTESETNEFEENDDDKLGL